VSRFLTAHQHNHMLVHAGKYRTEDKIKYTETIQIKLTTTQKSKQCKTQQ